MVDQELDGINERLTEPTYNGTTENVGFEINKIAAIGYSYQVRTTNMLATFMSFP